ncbi:phage major capsid protein [Actinomadura scrupuli]|uniref:phage major capsid protein n=1 Tax=Actinomadura scrupuli TaxID=559629 RepID=UPI003D981A81
MARKNGWLAPIGHMPDPGDIIGYRKNGLPIRSVGGGAVNDVTTWTPEEFSGDVVQKVLQKSAIEAYARPWPMANTLRHVPRSAGMDVAGVAAGGTYAEDTSTNDEVLLTARKMGQALRLNDEDMKDNTLVDIIATKKMDWATSFAKFYDQACLGCTAAENGTTVLFTSVYKSLRTTQSGLGYTADDNYVVSASGSAVSYDNLSTVLSLAEVGDYWDDGEALVIAHPSFKAKVRNIRIPQYSGDTGGLPVFVQGQGGDSGTPDTLFGHPIRWSLGAKTHATNTSTPTGNPLLIVGNRQMLFRGVRSGPESAVAGADSGPAFLTDQALLKMRARRGFAVAHPKAFAVLEDA